MRLAIKFSNTYIDIMEYKVVGERIKLNKYVRGKIPEGAVENGIVINTNGVATALRELMKENQIRNQKAVLTIACSDFIRKEIEIPQSPSRHVRGLLQNELNKQEILGTGYTFDYILNKDFKPDKGQLQQYKVFLLPVELIKNYKTTFQRAGIKLVGIKPVQDSMENLAKIFGLKTKENPTLLVSAEEQEVNILLVGAGTKSVYRNRQIHEDAIEENIFIVSAVQKIQEYLDTEEQVLEMLLEEISKLVQFQSQRDSSKQINSILVYGQLAEKQSFIDNLTLRSGIEAKRCTLPETIMAEKIGKNQIKGFHIIGALISTLNKKHQLSFIGLPEEEDYFSTKDKIPFYVGMGFVLLLCIVCMCIKIGNMQIRDKIEEDREAIVAIEQQEEYQRRVKIQKELQQLVKYNTNCDLCIQTLEQEGRFETKLFKEVDDLVIKGVQIQSHRYENRTVILECVAEYQDGPADFAKVVTNSNLFENVQYTGFQAYTDINGTVHYSFQLECMGKKQKNNN